MSRGGDGDGYSNITVVFVLAGNCGACISLKKSGTLDKTVRDLEAEGVKIKKVELPLMASRISGNDSFTKIINGYGHTWFPFIMATSTAMVEKAQREHVDEEAFIKASSVFNGQYVNGHIVENRAYGRLNTQTFMQWIDAYIKSDAYKKALSIAPLGGDVLTKSIVLQKTKPSNSSSRSVGHQVTTTLVFENEGKTHTKTGPNNHKEIEVYSNGNANFTIVPRNSRYGY